MNKPEPKYELHTDVMSEGVWITVESADMARRVEQEAPDYGEIEYRQGEEYSWVNAQTGVIRHETHAHYSITIRPTFDLLEVAKWLGRGGIVEACDKRYLPETEEEI